VTYEKTQHQIMTDLNEICKGLQVKPCHVRIVYWRPQQDVYMGMLEVGIYKATEMKLKVKELLEKRPIEERMYCLPWSKGPMSLLNEDGEGIKFRLRNYEMMNYF